MSDMSNMIVLSGSSNPVLAESISRHLNRPLGKVFCSRFSDGEIQVEIQENVRGKDVFIVQSTCAPTNDSVMELLMLADAVRRSSGLRITAVIPYFGYARQDRRPRSARVPISAKVIADMLTTVGFDRILTVDLHADQIQGFFYIPVDNVYASPLFIDDIHKKNIPDVMMVSPDVGGVARARAVAKRLENSDLAIIDKRRPQANEARVMNIIGDVKGRHCVIVDDIVDTAGTLCKAAAALKEEGATAVSAYCTHAVLSGPAIKNISESVIDELVVTDTIPLTEAAKNCKKIRQLSLAPMISEAIRRVSLEESISSMFPE